MDKWIDVVTDPLGLAGFALFLVFTLLARHSRADEVLLRLVFAGLAVFAVVGGLALSWVDHGRGESSAAAQPTPAEQRTGARMDEGETQDPRAKDHYPVLVTSLENNTIGERANSLRDILEDVVFALGGHPVERKAIDNIVQGLQFSQSSGLVDPSKFASIGRMVGARYVLVAS